MLLLEAIKLRRLNSYHSTGHYKQDKRMKLTLRSVGRHLIWPVLAVFCANAGLTDEMDGLSAADREELAYTTGVQAFIYSYPLLHVNEFRHMFHSPDSAAYRGPANRLNHARKLASGSAATAATPNNDTLYTLAFLDLSQGPILLETPKLGDRYFTIQLADAYATNFGDIGSRHNGGKPGRYMVVGPGWDGELPANIDEVYRSPTPWAMTLLRVLVDNPKELEEVHLLQDGFSLLNLEGKSLQPLSAESLPTPPASKRPQDLWAVINRELTANPPPESHRVLLDQFALVGIGPGQPQDISQLEAAVQRGLARAAGTGMKLVQAAADNISGGLRHNGWSYTQANIGRYGNDFLYRAGVTRMGLMANDPVEAAYLALYEDSEGTALNGQNGYSLRFDADKLPPARAFWSVTIYDRKTYKLVQNVADRFSIGDRTAGLEYAADGSLTINIAHNPPPTGQRSNWLPAPAGEFYLILRIYNPEKTVLEQTWLPPGLTNTIRVRESS